MQAYIYKNQIIDEIRENGWKPEHEPIMSEHFQYLKQWMEDGKLLLAGPCEDEAFGIVIFYGESDDDAQAFMDNDPAIRDGIMTAEWHRFRVSLFGDKQ
jgi:uncharacterized protein YciI